MENMWTTKSATFANWPFTEKVSWSVVSTAKALGQPGVTSQAELGTSKGNTRRRGKGDDKQNQKISGDCGVRQAKKKVF